MAGIKVTNMRNTSIQSIILWRGVFLLNTIELWWCWQNPFCSNHPSHEIFEITHFHSQALSDNFVNCPSSDEITYQLIIISVELNPFLNVLIVAEYQNVLKGVYFINILRSAIFKMWHKTLQLRQLCLAVAGLALLGLYVRWFLNCHEVQYCVEILCQCL